MRLLNWGCILPLKLPNVNRWLLEAICAAEVSCLPLLERSDTARFILKEARVSSKYGDGRYGTAGIWQLGFVWSSRNGVHTYVRERCHTSFSPDSKANPLTLTIINAVMTSSTVEIYVNLQ